MITDLAEEFRSQGMNPAAGGQEEEQDMALESIKAWIE